MNVSIFKGSYEKIEEKLGTHLRKLMILKNPDWKDFEILEDHGEINKNKRLWLYCKWFLAEIARLSLQKTQMKILKVYLK